MTHKRTLIFGVLGAAAIALGAQIRVPMEPVPMTLQTLAVLVIGGVWGWRAGVAATVLYFCAALLGLPVLSGWTRAPGAALFSLKSLGYVLAFIPAAAIASRAPRGRLLGVGTLLGAHAVILAIGGAVLASHIGLGPAWKHGVEPFLIGAAVKSAVAALLLPVLRRI